MAEFGMHEAKTHLSRLVERALAGEEIVITRHGKPAVRLAVVEREPAIQEPPRVIWPGATAPDELDLEIDELSQDGRIVPEADA